jgi:multicomponent Na+:H+ antiporter subunit B
MNSLIFRAATRALEPLLVLFSIFLMLVGHNQPGGGFVGGLILAAAFSLHALAFDVGDARRVLRVDPRTLIAAGLLLALLAGLLPVILGQPLLTGLWAEVSAPGFDDPLHVGTPLLFDIGVYLLVAGVALLMILTLAEE